MDPGSDDAWTTVDRKVTKKKKEEQPDEGWSQVAGKDKRKKESTTERRQERRGDSRGKPPQQRGGGASSGRNTLPRKQSGANAGGPRDSGPHPPAGGRGGGRDGRGFGRGGSRPARSTPSPSPMPYSKPDPVSAASKSTSNPATSAPVKSSWANLVGNKDSNSLEETRDEIKAEPVESVLKVDEELNTVKEIPDAPVNETISVDNNQKTVLASEDTSKEICSESNLESVPSTQSSDITTSCTEQPKDAATCQVDSCSNPPSQNADVDKSDVEVIDKENDIPEPDNKPDDTQGLVFNLDKNIAERTDLANSTDQDSNGNSVNVDVNKNFTEMTIEEIVSCIDPDTRQYDRDILLQLQKHPLSLQKPDKLPELEIVRDAPLRSSSSAPLLGDKPPQYVHNFPRQGPPPKRDSRRKESSKKVISLSREPVKLHKAENAWTPGSKGGVEQQSELDDVLKKVRAILNKLTPQKFDTLVVKFKEIRIDTEEKLVQCMELVFDKALDEPAFSKAYASMCRELFLKKVDSVDFSNLLLRRCQKEFDQDYMSDSVKEKYEKDLAAAETEDDQKRIKAEFEQLETKLRRRSLGNIKFIAELYKLQLLRHRIMHSIIQRLLLSKEEEGLECLCQLLTTCGSQIEAEVEKIPLEHRSGYKFDKYFDGIGRIINDKKCSSRVRFLLQDVVDLRNNKWVSRRKEAGPKTIEEIHKEAKLEALKIQLADQNPDPPPGRRNEDRNRRKTEYRPKPRQDEGWSNVPTRAAKISDIVDPERFRQIQKVDADLLQLGPGFGQRTWGAGSSANRPAEPSRSINRFQMLDVEHSVPPIYAGRASEPVLNTAQRARTRDKPSSSDASRDQSLEFPHTTLRGRADMDEEVLRTKFATLLEEYISNCDFDETLSSICELFSLANLQILPEETFNLGLNKKSVDRERCAKLLVALMERGCLTVSKLVDGLAVLLEVASDIVIDIPKFWEWISDMLAPVLVARDCFGAVVEQCSSRIDEATKSDFLGSLLRSVNSSHPDLFDQVIQRNYEILTKLLDKDLASYLKELNLDVTPQGAAAGGVTTDSVKLVNGSLQEDLYKKLSGVFAKNRTGNDEMSSVDAILCDKAMDRETVKTVVTAVIESVVDGLGGPSIYCKLNEERIKGRLPILKKYIDADKDRELFALFAIQGVVTKLEHPNKLLHRILEVLYDNDCISEDALFDWEKSDDPEEQEGKGVALKSCNQLFNWLKTAEEDEAA